MSNDYNGKKRSELPDSVFGIPQERKYPMPDEKHTRSAIKLFNHVDPKYEEQLAKAVIKNMKRYGIDGSVVGPNNRLRKYLPKDMIKESSIEEGFLKSDKDIYYNKDKFDSGEINLCFITGLSGSGKSTMGRNMSSKNIEHYEMDDVICNDNFSDDNLKEYGGLISSFFKGAGKSFRLIRDDDKHNDSVFNTHKNYEKEITQAFVKHAISYCKSHKGIKYVCDGIWIFMFIKPEQLKDCAVYIKGTSSIKSGYRALKRDIDEDKRNGMTSLQIFKHEFKRVKEDILYARENQKELKSFRFYFEKQSTNESVSSTVSKDHKQKGYISLSSLKKVHITESVINKYKKEYPVLRHVRCKDTNEYICDGYMWFKENDLVCYVGSCQYTDDHTKWIVSLEIIPKYRGYGLSTQILDFCVKSMKCKYLSVNKNNELAKKIYDKYGFKVYHEDKTMYYMTLDSIIKESSSRKITTVVFDLGDVLIKSNMQEKLRKNPKIPNQQIYPLLEKWFDDDLDLLSKEEYIDTISKRLAPDFSDIVPDIVDAFSDIEVLSYTIPTLKDLKERGYNIYYLSNWSRWGVEILRENNKLDFLSLFDGGLFSYEVGVKKPDRKIYDAFLKKFKINPKEAIFVDNKKKNIDAAEKFGIKGVLFSNEKDLQKYIKNMQSNINESYLLQEASSNKVYHLSQTNLDGKTIQPTVPSNYMTKNGYEDGNTKRVCFATSIDGCLRGLSLKCEGMKLFVHIPDGNYNIYKPSNKEVPDASITGEVWIKKAVKMKCIGQIYVIGDKGEDGIPYKYGDKTAELYDWEWKWIDKFNESLSILPQDTGISTVIFDIGDVLVSANIKDYLMADPEIPNEIVDELLKLWFIDKDEVDDTMDLDTYREIVNKRMGVEFSKYIPKLFKYNVECVTAFNYTIPMIQDLKDKGYKVYYLSNWSAWTHDLLQEAGKFDFLKLMDGGVFSYVVGYMKPNEEIYKILLNKYKINPEEAVFFDDREENIEVANKMGIHGVHFPRHDSSIVYDELAKLNKQSISEKFLIPTKINEDKIAKEIESSIKSIVMTSANKSSASKLGLTLKCKLEDVDSRIACILILDGSQDKRDTDEARTILKDIANKCKSKLGDLVSKVDIGDGDEGCLYFTMNRMCIIKNRKDLIQEYGMTRGTIVGANQPLYFYHMVDSGANLSKGLLSLEYLYNHNKPLFLKNASKYRNRLCDGWDIYPGRDPKSLTAEEIYEGIKKFRNEDNLNSIYFFRYPPYSSLDKRFDRLYKYKKLYRININDTKVKSIIKNINYGWIDSNRYNDPLDRKYYETISPEDYFNNFDPDKGLLFSTLYYISIEVKNGYIPMRLLEEVKAPNTIEDIISMEESSIQEYGTTGGTIVGANQPDSVYIVNYMQNNVFSGYKEPKQAICKKGMNQMYTTKNGKAIPVDIDKFKEEASDISVFRFKETPILSFDKIIENASVYGDFYMLLTGDYPTNQHEIAYDNRFVQEENFLDELDDITCCTESTIISQIEATDYPYMKILTESMEGRCWNYYRDINGVFAMNELTGLRTPSYEDIADIPNSQIQLIERGTVYFGD